MVFHSRSLCLVLLAGVPIAAAAEGVRVVRFSESEPFRMGEVTSRRIVHPGLGAKNTTLNFSISKPGAEFAQHVHDGSDDTILVLEGEVNLRQGDALHLFKAGECAFVPAGQIHGTVTAGTSEAVMISFQNPPDLILYTGARDSKRPGAAAPKGDITPGAVKYLNFRSKNGFFTTPAMGSRRAAGSHRKLKRGETFRTRVEPGGEQVLFVWRGALRVNDGKSSYKAGERDTVFISGASDLEVTGDANGETELIQVQAPLPGESNSMTRRLFTTIAASAPLQGASAAKIRVAVIGTGHGHAASKIQALQSMPEYEFAGVCRPDKDDPAIGNVFAGVRWLALDDVLGDASIELVAMESADAERNLHFAQRAIDAGKFVHLDKPPGASLAGLRKLLEDARQRKRVVQMGYQWRYHPAMQAAMEAARQGWLGRVYRFRASIDKLINAEERRHLAKYRGGMLFSEACHLVDRATALLGKPDKVTGFIGHHSPLADGLADNTMAVLTYPEAIAEISLAGFDPHGNQHRYVEILGTNGSAKAQPFAPVRLVVDLDKPAGPYYAGEQILAPPSPPGLTYTPDFSEMAAVIRNGAAPSYTAKHDLMTHEVLLDACGML